jgi:Family of unknown function (DUF6084)
MVDLDFECLGGRAEPYAAVPTLALRIGLTEASGQPIHTVALRCQIRIQPARRRYSPQEAERLLDLFGETSRWGDTLKPLQFATVSHQVPGFTARTEFDLLVPCTYDFEVASAKYFHALDDGEIPLLMLFSGTVFARVPGGFAVEPVPWDKEVDYRLPVRVWRELMDRYFPNSAWLRLRRDTLDALQLFKSRQALATWDEAIEALLKQSGEAAP